MKWDLALGVATDTRESLANSGKNPEVEVTFGRAFAEDLQSRELNPNENKVLALAVKAKPDQTLCSTWDLTDWQGNAIRIGFVARTALEPGPGGADHLVAQAMNWRAELKGPVVSTHDLAQRILDGLRSHAEQFGGWPPAIGPPSQRATSRKSRRQEKNGRAVEN